MHRLSSSFILGYHGCDRSVAEQLIQGEQSRKSDNDYDWLGPGVYFWEANPQRALAFAQKASGRNGSKIRNPAVVGAVLDLGLCLDLTTTSSLDMLRIGYAHVKLRSEAEENPLPTNSADLLRRNLDCAVIRRLHTILEEGQSEPIDSVKGVFTEGDPVYPGAGFLEETHIQIAICNLRCIKGVFWPDPESLNS
jgi:hypothetical protein